MGRTGLVFQGKRNGSREFVLPVQTLGIKIGPAIGRPCPALGA